MKGGVLEGGEKFAGVEDVVWVEGFFEGEVGLVGDIGDGVAPPAVFGDADAVFSCDGAFPGDDLEEEFVEGGFGAFADGGVFHGGDHDVDVDVAVASVTEAGDGEAGLFLEFGGEGDEVDEA